VAGEDLAEKLARGPLGVDEAREIATQVAAALEAAHEQGVIHRDLKPGNIRITPEGIVKVLDFGLAKALSDEDSVADRATSPTVTSEGTSAGTILGTAAYMSPEQARGEPLDRRCDIWAFGCVLYECLAGKRAFQGKSTGEAISSVLRSDPDLTAILPDTPRSMVRLLRRCLTKKAQQRLRDIGDARLELEDPEGGLEAATAAAAPSALHSIRRQRTALLVLSIVLLAGLLYVLFGPRDEGPGSATSLDARWRIRLPEGERLDWHRTSANLSKLGGGSRLLALSPDGETIIFSVADEEGSQLRRRRLDELESRPIDGTDDARGPFFSPDGQWVGFLADNSLQVAPVERGGARRICDVSSQNFAGSWTPDGEQIVFSTNKGLWRVSAQGGDPEQLAAPRRDQGEGEFALSSLLPDGSGALFTTGTAERSEVALLSLEDGSWATILRNAAHAHYIAGGHLIYAHGGGLWSAPYDLGSGEVSETPTLLLGGVHTTLGAGGSVVAHYALAGNGVLVYAPELDSPTRSTLVWVDRAGNEELLTEGPGRWEHPRVSPDQRRIAFDILDARGKDIFLFDLARGQVARLTSNGASTAGLWSRDGSRVLGSDLASNGIVSNAADFSGHTEHFPNPGHTTAGGWAPDGLTVVFTERDTAGNWAIGSVRTDTPGSEPRGLISSEANERWPAPSPDGGWLAYVADERGTREVFVRPYPELDRRIKVSSNGGGEPVWSADGRELFYRAKGQMFVVEFDSGDVSRPSTPAKLFDDPYDAEPGGHQHYDVSGDGRRFAMIRIEEPAPTEVRVVSGVLPRPDAP